DEDEPPDAARVSRGELRSEEPAEGVPGDVRTADSDRVEPPREPCGHLCELRRPSSPRQIDHVHPAAVAQQVDERRPPTPRARKPVNQHERLTCARDATAN